MFLVYLVPINGEIADEFLIVSYYSSHFNQNKLIGSIPLEYDTTSRVSETDLYISKFGMVNMG